jgi:hypothetical protein
MQKCIGSLKDSRGDIIFSMEGDTFLISSHNKQVAISDDELKEVNGKLYANIKFLNMIDFPEVEVPEHVLELKTQYRKEIALAKNSVAIVEHEKGKIYLSVSNDCRVYAKLGDKTAITEKIYLVEGKKAIYVPDLELETSFLEVPEIVEDKLKAAKKAIEMKDLRLVYAGKSLLSGKDYYKLSCEVPSQTWYRVRECFEYHGERGIPGALEGWVTAVPDLVEEYLRLRNTISSRKDEIENQKAQAAKGQKKLTEAILKAQ